jgi:signal transduction histidine kinase
MKNRDAVSHARQDSSFFILHSSFPLTHLNSNSHDAEYQRLVDQSVEIARLAGSLAHEIKNPLSVILMNMDLLAEDLAEGSTPRERRALTKVSTVRSQCKRLQHLLDDFLSFARAVKLELKPTNLNEVVSEVLDFVERQMEEAGVEVIRHLQSDLSSVLVDRQKIQAAILNLLLNAQQAMPDGGQLWVQTRETSSTVALDLIDTGSGIDDETLLHIFEPFYSTKASGSGLGLPTTRRIIEGHDGTINVQSKPGKGTQFSLEFPLPTRIGGGDSPATA